MHKMDLPIDKKEAAAIERRRNMEQQRSSRIFDAKQRTIGVDLDALEQQEQDKQQQENSEQARHEAFAADSVRNDRIAMMMENRQNQDTRELNMATNEFRSQEQQPSSRREFDLNDPEALKKDKPARVSDDDARCGVSSIQKFEGEDLSSKQRTAMQQEQAREWYTQQQDEKMQTMSNQQKADHLYNLKMKQVDQVSMELQNAEHSCQRAINMATKDYNQALANEIDERNMLQKKQESDDNNTEIANHVFGDMLTENPAVAQSAFGPHRVITDRWKGMSPEEVEAVRQEQENQRKEKERLQEQENLVNKEWERQSTVQARAGTLMERDINRQTKNINKEMAEENRRLAADQKSNQEHLTKEVYTNPPTGAYFGQFNKSSR